MLRYFDYLFYRIVHLNEKILGYKDKDVIIFGGITVLSLFQNINIITIFSLIKPKDELSNKQAVIFFLSFFLIIIGLNYLRYIKFAPLSLLENKHGGESKKTKQLKGIGIILYSILSLYLVSIV